METTEYLLGIGAILLGIIGFFVRSVLADVKELKKSEIKSALLNQRIGANEKHIEKNESTMFKKMSGIHAKQEIQGTLINEIKADLSGINGKLDILIGKK